jgi:hypothetical protein
MNRFQTTLIAMLILGFSVTANLGCQTWGTKSGSTAWWKKSKEPVPPDAPENFGEAVKMDIAWKDDVLPGPDGKLQRGVGGRVHFLDKNGKAVRVHGSMTVYGFDEQNGKVTSPRPDKRFHFKDDELQQVYGASTIGHSYSIWLPWDDQGYQRHVAVLPIFRAPDGRLLKGDHAQAVLHGPANPNPITQVQERQRRLEENQMVERTVYQSGNSNPQVSQVSGETPLDPIQRVRTIGVPSSANAIRQSVQNGTSQIGATPLTPAPIPPAASSGPTGLDAGSSRIQNYTVRPYQPGLTSPANQTTSEQSGSSSSNWNRAKDQFMKLGPRKNTGLPGAR